MRRCEVAKFVAAQAEKTLQVPLSLLTEARDHPDKVAKVVIRQLPNEVCEPTGPEGWRLITLVERTKELTLGQQAVDRLGRCSTSFESGPKAKGRRTFGAQRAGLLAPPLPFTGSEFACSVEPTQPLHREGELSAFVAVHHDKDLPAVLNSFRDELSHHRGLTRSRRSAKDQMPIRGRQHTRDCRSSQLPEGHVILMGHASDRTGSSPAQTRFLAKRASCTAARSLHEEASAQRSELYLTFSLTARAITKTRGPPNAALWRSSPTAPSSSGPQLAARSTSPHYRPRCTTGPETCNTVPQSAVSSQHRRFAFGSIVHGQGHRQRRPQTALIGLRLTTQPTVVPRNPHPSQQLHVELPCPSSPIRLLHSDTRAGDFGSCDRDPRYSDAFETDGSLRLATVPRAGTRNSGAGKSQSS